MITNLELTLDEMKKQAKTEGVKEGEKRGRMEVARMALGKGLAVDVVVEITGLSREIVLQHKGTVLKGFNRKF